MSCSLIGSILKNCRDSAGGVIEMKVKILPSRTTLDSDYSVTSGTVSIASNSRSGWYTYYLEKNTSVFTNIQTVNVPNGTRVWKQDGTIILNKTQASIDRELNVLGQNDLQIVIRDANDTYRLYGYEFGMQIATAEDTTGTTKEDRNGYTVKFTADERVSTPYMSSASYAQLVT